MPRLKLRRKKRTIHIGRDGIYGSETTIDVNVPLPTGDFLKYTVMSWGLLVYAGELTRVVGI